ncbi:YTH domain-containing protein ECT4 [Sesamum alatum]|uniref:YTH domain-containing family protein n=1 Tax=Sesamum alatum TaxID=300844 RepID=A0AAE1Y6U9_9LAMI|nr:YTH domain-containing protein ECT4 [Sesamum alatum]
MPGDKKTKTSELIAHRMMSDSNIKLPKKDMGEPSGRISSVSAAGNAVSGIKGVSDQLLAAVQGVYYPASTCYDYYYPGYNGTFSQSNDKGYFKTSAGSYMGIQQENASLLYYLPGYAPYTTGFLGADGKQALTSSEYLQQLCSYGSEAFPCYAYASTSAGTGSTGAAARSGSLRPVIAPSGSGKSHVLNTAKTNHNLSTRTSAYSLNPKLQQHASCSLRPIYQNQSINPLNKLGSGFQPSDLIRGFQPAGNFSSFTNRSPGVFTRYGPVNFDPNDLVWHNNYRYNSREDFGGSGEIKPVTELTRGPRADSRNNSSKLPSEVKQLAFAVERDEYNLKEFRTEYDSAKFYVIKSYSEDDIHKCIKYDVWSSTPNGNKKLDSGFHEAEVKTNETGKKCPVFLFFSVNSSGQFVGVAEMIGRVDFSKNMDFWQLDKWNGYFPVKWHIIKDVPNTLLRHIVLENNENRPVTYSRDTQEIGLEQGLEMLRIFKSYSEKTSVLDDFNFYEHREEAIKGKGKNTKPASRTNDSKTGDYKKHFAGVQSAKTDKSDSSSL